MAVYEMDVGNLHLLGAPGQRLGLRWNVERFLEKHVPSNYLRISGLGFAPASCAEKLGHPVPLSNCVVDRNNSWPHPAHLKVPGRFSAFRGLVPGRSVP